MKVPERMEELTIFITLDSNDRSKIEALANGLISKANNEFGKYGYDVKDTYSFSSDNGFKGRFHIKVSPNNNNGDSAINIIDAELAKQHELPTLEPLTAKMVDIIRERDGLDYAYVCRSEIPGLDFLENYIVKEDINNYWKSRASLPPEGKRR